MNINAQQNPKEWQEWQNFLVSTYADRVPAVKTGMRRDLQTGDAKAATCAFQRNEGLDETGELDVATQNVVAARYGFGARFRIGPDQKGDLRQQRPYFLVPLDEGEGELKKVRDRIVKHMAAASSEDVVATLRRRDVKDWKALTEALTRAANAIVASPAAAAAAALAPADAVARKLCAHFTPDTLAQLHALAQSGVAIGRDGQPRLRPGLRDALLAEINDALATGALDDHAATLDEGRPRIKRNRRTLQSAFPDVFEEAWLRGPITDIYVLSHGWHRNFFGAVGAYDRITSHLSLLMHRERFAEIRPSPPFHPLFLMLHWHSDPGQNGWVDRAGRRRRAVFLENCERQFERPGAHEERDEAPAERFSAVFESIYALFSRMSVPETAVLTDESITADATTLAGHLDRFRLRDAPAAEQADKVAAAWAAYQTSPAERPLANQQRKAGRFVPWWRALLDLTGFIVSIVGLVAAVTALLSWASKSSALNSATPVAKNWWQNALDQAQTLPGWPPLLLDDKSATIAMTGAFALITALFAYLWLFVPTLWKPDERRRDGVNLARLLAFLLLLIPCALPLVLFSFGTYILGATIPNAHYGILKLLGNKDRRHKLHLRTLFDERIGNRDETITDPDYRDLIRERPSVSGGAGAGGAAQLRWEVAANWFRFPRYHLARLARWPIRLLRAGLAPENPGHPLADQVDNQFAFWEMQVAGVNAGRRAAHFLAPLLKEMATAKGSFNEEDSLTDLSTVRVHLMGHSFGGLVVSNLLRHLALDPECRRPELPAIPVLPKVESVCFLQAAMASTWFEHEKTLCDYVRGGVGCIYSAYDTANGFYYPLANNARISAGFVGFYWAGGSAVAGQNSFQPIALPPHASTEKSRQNAKPLPSTHVPIGQGVFSALVVPPALRGLAERVRPHASAYFPLFVNIDASRLIAEGPPGSGGGHGDIYKDDVMHLCWAVTHLGRRVTQLPAPIPHPPGAAPPDPLNAGAIVEGRPVEVVAA